MNKWGIIHGILVTIAVILVFALLAGYGYLVLLLAEKGII